MPGSTGWRGRLLAAVAVMGAAAASGCNGQGSSGDAGASDRVSLTCRWRSQTSPTAATIHDIWGASSTELWAAAVSGILRYDGYSWRATSTVTPAMGALRGIWGSSGSDIFAVGGTNNTPLILHYDGQRWSEMTPAGIWQLVDVWGSSGSDVFAVGEGNGPMFILHYDGSRWSEMTTTIHAQLQGVWGSSRSNVYAVGGHTNNSGRVVRYDGRKWFEVHNTNEGTLVDVWGSSGSDVYAVGRDRALHFDGQRWTSTTLVSGGGWVMESIHGSSARTVMAVGWDQGDGFTSVVLRHTDFGWQRDSATPGKWLRSVFVLSDREAFACGGDHVARQGILLRQECL